MASAPPSVVPTDSMPACVPAIRLPLVLVKPAVFKVTAAGVTTSPDTRFVKLTAPGASVAPYVELPAATVAFKTSWLTV